jgi:hypothetical protein
VNAQGLLAVIAVATPGFAIVVARQPRLGVPMSPEFRLGVIGGLLQGSGLILVGAYGAYETSGGRWWTPMLVAGALVFFTGNFLALQRGIQVGRALVVVTLNGIVTNLFSIGGGILVLGEHLPASRGRAALQVVALATIVVMSGVLARLSTAESASSGEPLRQTAGC